jgi:hypothetical protein
MDLLVETRELCCFSFRTNFFTRWTISKNQELKLFTRWTLFKAVFVETQFKLQYFLRYWMCSQKNGPVIFLSKDLREKLIIKGYQKHEFWTKVAKLKKQARHIALKSQIFFFIDITSKSNQAVTHQKLWHWLGIRCYTQSEKEQE